MTPPTASIDPSSAQGRELPLAMWDMPLEAGARGQVVATLQSMLVRRGFPIAVDGSIGPQTMRAVESAFLTLAESKSIEARRLTAVGYAGLTVGQAIDVLVRAYAALDGISGASQPVVNSMPSEPDAVIVMTPADAAAMDRRITGGFPWKRMAVGALAIGGLAWLASRR